MMRIVMLQDVTEEIPGRGARMHYYQGQTYEVPDGIGEIYCRRKQARLFDTPEEDPEVSLALETKRRELRLERLKQEAVAVSHDAEQRHFGEAAAVKEQRVLVRKELEAAESAPLQRLTPQEQEYLKWLVQP